MENHQPINIYLDITKGIWSLIYLYEYNEIKETYSELYMPNTYKIRNNFMFTVHKFYQNNTVVYNITFSISPIKIKLKQYSVSLFFTIIVLTF